jgi:hypothetical protein
VACGFIAALAWSWGYSKRKEEEERKAANAKTKEAEILSRPHPDNWSGSVDRL